MLRAITVLSLILTLSACDSRINPLNWFGGEREQRIRVDPDATRPNAPTDGRVLVAEITQLSVEQSTSGAIIRATGLTASQGYFNAELVLVDATDAQVTFEFRAAPPNGGAMPGLQQIVAGQTLSVGELQGIRTITVIAQNNRRSVNRR